MSSSVALSLDGGLESEAESGILRSDSKEAARPRLALVRDLANPQRVFYHSSRNKRANKKTTIQRKVFGEQEKRNNLLPVSKGK